MFTDVVNKKQIQL